MRSTDNEDGALIRLRQFLAYDPRTGEFAWMVPRQGVKPGAVAGYVNSDGYRVIMVDGVLRRAHRIAWLFVHGAWPTNEIDHINGQRADNRIANLRDVSGSINLQNQRAANSNNKSGFLGVHWVARDERWQARIRAPLGKTKHLGYFATPELAHAAYLEAKRRMHPGGTL